MPSLLELSKITVPKFLLTRADVVQILPAVNAGIVTVVENKTHGVTADRLNAFDVHIALSDLKFCLIGRVSRHFRRGRKDTKKFEGKRKALSVIKSNVKTLALFVQAHVNGKHHLQDIL